MAVKSVSHDRKVCAYLTPKNDAIFNAYSSVEGVGKSELVNMAIKEYFQKFPPEKRQQYISAHSKNSY